MVAMKSVSVVSGMDRERFAWSRLERFRNVAFTTDVLCEMHSVPASHRKNVVKQAHQIRHCLTQAKEYFEAAKAVSLATSPLLYYYGTMSFALAEILFKQDGRSSFDQARSENRHHGLIFHGGDSISKGDELSVSAEKLKATPHIAGGGRRGTFSLWHRSAREYPFCGSVKERRDAYETNSFALAGVPSDDGLKPIPEAGISLLQCIRHIEDMRYLCHSHGIYPLIVPARVEAILDYRSRSITQNISISNAHPEAIAKVMDGICIDAKEIDRVNVTKVGGGYLINSRCSMDHHQHARYPSSVRSAKDILWMFADNVSLNEFGLYYVSLFIAGNYARYYPDRWMADVESSSAIAAAMGELVEIVERRVPTLMASELERSLIIYA